MRRINSMAMVALFAVIATCMTAQDAAAEDITWHRNYGEALKEAQESDRPLLVKVSATWCGYCTKMNRETLADGDVITDINENFVALELDADRDRELINQFRVSSFPTTIVVAPDRTIVRRLPGFQSRTEFRTGLRDALNLVR